MPGEPQQRLRWQKSTERDWDVCLVVEEQEETHQGCEITPLSRSGQQQKIKEGPMTYETINVRLTRSNTSISWGFQLQQRGQDIIVSKSESGSMSEKAGISLGDTVQEIFGQSAQNLNTAMNRIQQALEITMTLRRPIKNSPSLPWAFQTTPQGQLAVDQYNQQGQFVQRSDAQTKGFVNSFISESKAPVGPPNDIEQRRQIRGSNEMRTTNGPATVIQQPRLDLPYNTTTHKAESNSNWKQNDGDVTRHYESKRTYTRTESSSLPPDGNYNKLNGGVMSGHGVQAEKNVGGGGYVQSPAPKEQSQTAVGFGGSQQQALAAGPPVQNQPRQQISTTQGQHQTLASGPNVQPQQQRSGTQGAPHLARNQHNDQLNKFQTGSVPLPGGVDYVRAQQPKQQMSEAGIQQGYPKHPTADQSQRFMAEYGTVGAGQQNTQQASTGQNTYRISQYEQTDTINFPTQQQQRHNNQGGNVGYEQQVSNVVYQQQPGYHQVYQGQTKSDQGGQNVQFQQHQQLQERQRDHAPQQDVNQTQYGQNQQRTVRQPQYNQQLDSQAQHSHPQRVSNVTSQAQHTHQNFNQPQQSPNINQNFQQFGGGPHQQSTYQPGYGSLPRQSRSTRYAEAPEWQSQTLDRGYQLRTESARRSRSQPRCCSRSELPQGPIIFYYPPHPRTYRELSPSARVRYLQHNYPLDFQRADIEFNLSASGKAEVDPYSDEVAAEAYQQTGQDLPFIKLPDGLQPDARTAYLKSETCRLIREQKLGIRPPNAPPIQSASLKRIANAVGVSLD